MKQFHSSVALLSGGLDSTVALAVALSQSEKVHVLSFKYGQRHHVELMAAAKVIEHYRVENPDMTISWRVQEIDLRQWGGSALTDDIAVPKSDNVSDIPPGIPVTYVPGRNTIFLSFALSLAEATGSDRVFIGVNALDYSGYPDCRPEFIKAMNEVYRLGTRAADGYVDAVEIEAPIINLTKAEIIRLGWQMHAPLRLSWSCYDPQPDLTATRQNVPVQGEFTPCGRCDSCLIREKGFFEART